MSSKLAVLGGGPIGLEVCAAALSRNMNVTLIERGKEVGTNVRAWGHVDLFSDWTLNCSEIGLQLLREASTPLAAEVSADMAACPVASEFVTQYLGPLLEVLQAKYAEKFKVVMGQSVISCTKVIVHQSI